MYVTFFNKLSAKKSASIKSYFIPLSSISLRQGGLMKKMKKNPDDPRPLNFNNDEKHGPSDHLKKPFQTPEEERGDSEDDQYYEEEEALSPEETQLRKEEESL
jgi:hypothetical protein